VTLHKPDYALSQIAGVPRQVGHSHIRQPIPMPLFCLNPVLSWNIYDGKFDVMSTAVIECCAAGWIKCTFTQVQLLLLCDYDLATATVAG